MWPPSLFLSESSILELCLSEKKKSNNNHLSYKLEIWSADRGYRGSHMKAHVLLNLLNELRKKDKMRGFAENLSFPITSLINSISEHECKFLFIIQL